jgi:hypothetical protein
MWLAIPLCISLLLPADAAPTREPTNQRFNNYAKFDYHVAHTQPRQIEWPNYNFGYPLYLINHHQRPTADIPTPSIHFSLASNDAWRNQLRHAHQSIPTVILAYIPVDPRHAYHTPPSVASSTDYPPNIYYNCHHGVVVNRASFISRRSKEPLAEVEDQKRSPSSRHQSAIRGSKPARKRLSSTKNVLSGSTDYSNGAVRENMVDTGVKIVSQDVGEQRAVRVSQSQHTRIINEGRIEPNWPTFYWERPAGEPKEPETVVCFKEDRFI